MLTLTSALLRPAFYLVSLLRTSPWFSNLVPRKYLLSLPQEVLYEVLYHLDWAELLAVGSTCRRLRAVTKTRLLWQSRALELSFSSGAPLLEGPIDTYTSEELEQKVIRRLQIRQRWRELDPTLFKSRKIDFQFPSSHILCLLPGGRWLLDNIDGRVYVADLDAPEITWNMLLDETRYNSRGDEVDPLEAFATWIDPSKPWLSVRIALHNKNTGYDAVSSRICIYQLEMTGRGSNTKWSAERIITLQAFAPCRKQQLRLEKDCVLERCAYGLGDSRVSQIHVYRYSDTPIRRCAWEYKKPARILLLSNDRVAMITETHFEISNLKPIGSDSLIVEPSFRLSLCSPPDISSVSRVYVNHHCSYIITASSGSVDTIQIPHDITISPSMKSLAVENFPERTQSLEFSLMVRLRTDYSMDFITYKVDEERDQVDSQVHIGGLPGVKRMITCDEASGRLILCRDGNYLLFQL